MGAYTSVKDLAAVFYEIRSRIATLEVAQKNPVPQYTTATLPTASTCTGLIVLDTTATQFKGSTGIAWVALN